jgi:sugar lactone lactonase YvrE/DNA-binding IclR family transcriptional regulator
MEPTTTPSESATTTPGLGVLEKAMGLLNIVSATRSPMTFTALLNASTLPKATLHRILSTLTREGLLRHDAYTRTYSLGLRLLELAHEVWSDFDLRVAAQDEMVRLRNKLGVAIQLAVLSNNHLILVASEDVKKPTVEGSQMGVRLPMHATALGKAILANLDREKQVDLLQSVPLAALTAQSMTSVELLLAELDLTRARGYALEDGESVQDELAIATPILDVEGRPIGALGVRCSLQNFTVARLHSLSNDLIDGARRISHNAGGQAMSIHPQSSPGDEQQYEITTSVASRAMLGEGPIWSPRDGKLYWVDILKPCIHCFDPQSDKDVEIPVGAMVSVAIPKATGGLLVAMPNGLMTFDTETKQLASFCHPEAQRPSNRYNDGKCDRLGRLWIGTMDMAAVANRGHLYRVDPDRTWKVMASGISVANGLGWSPDDRKMYFTDTARGTIYVYDFDLMSGQISNRQSLITLSSKEGLPDGLTVDAEGCLWVCLWDAWSVVRYSPEGEEMLRIRVPVPRPTSCCFGGNNLDTLYITSATVRLSEDMLSRAPQSGSLFSVKIPGVRGLPEATFAG